MKNVLIIIVTYNRLNLLKRCLDHCKLLEYEDRDIFVVDNNSDDGTSEFLLKNNIKNIKLDGNYGSAKGWYTGLLYALKLNYKFAWLMDDDGFPNKKSLTNLVNSYKDDYSCISSLVVSEDNTNQLVFPMPLLKFNFLSFLLLRFKFKNISILNKYTKNNIYEFAHLFNGSLINIKTVKKIGNVDQNYFMYGDEVDYFHRLKKVGKVVTNTKSIHYHPDVIKRKCSKFWIYYYVKNSIIINYKYKNLSTLRSIIIIILSLYRIINRNGFKEFLNILFLNKYKFYNAIFYGFKNKIGNDY